MIGTATATTTQPLRAGVIGLGVGKAHAEGYASTSGAVLTALCDSDPLRLREYAQKYNIPSENLFSDYKEMLAKGGLDIVSVCLPNYLHAEVTIAALNAGKHVLCEKPMASTVEQAEQMNAAAMTNNRRLMIAYNHRYRPDVQWIRRIIQGGHLGNIYHVYAAWRRETGIPGSGWFGNRQMAGGGALIDLGVHVLDLTMWMLGFPEVNTVSGDTHSLFGPRGMKTWGRKPGAIIEPPFDVDDGAVGFIRFANGANAVLEATWAEHRQPQDDLIRMEIQGTNGTVELNVANYTQENTLRFYTEIEGEPVTVIPTVRLDGPRGHVWLVQEIIQSLINGTEPPSNGEQGLLAVKVLQGLYESAQSGREISLRDLPSSAQ
jgi:predicted dehydrogenase